MAYVGIAYATAVAVSTISVALGWANDPAIGRSWSLTISLIVTGTIASAASISFVIGLFAARSVAEVHEKKLAVVAMMVLLASLGVAALIGSSAWYVLPLLQGFLIVGAIDLALHFEMLHPPTFESHCPVCGYVMTGLPSRRCPECGNDSQGDVE